NDVAPSRTMPWANTEAVFLQEQFKAASWLTFNGGLRLSHYGGPVSENAADPRVGAAIQVPHLNWVLRAFYGRYYQMPPLVTVSDAGPTPFFSSLRGERDEQREIGLTIPFQGWVFDVSNFRTGAHNFFDHDALGNSNVFFPLTLEHARIRGWEVSAKSPLVARRVSWRLAYSHQHAEWNGGITGGLITDESCREPLCFLAPHQPN